MAAAIDTTGGITTTGITIANVTVNVTDTVITGTAAELSVLSHSRLYECFS